jgi:hypothetical protein
MLKIEKFVTMSPEQWEMVIEGMRNPKNSWDRIDSYKTHIEDPETLETADFAFFVGENDMQLMESLAKGGPVHAKYRRMMPVWAHITAPLYWWKEFDTYKIGTVANSCSTMHKIHAKEFTLDDFSHEHMKPRTLKRLMDDIEELNFWRNIFLNGGMVDNGDGTAEVFKPYDKDAWWQMIQLLGSNYNQRRTVFFPYEVMANVHKWRRNHKIDEWHTLCDWIEELPYSELITMNFEE